MVDILLSLFLVLLGLGSGYLLQTAGRSGKLPAFGPDRSGLALRKFLQTFTLVGLAPLMIISGIWGSQRLTVELLVLPAIGLFTLIFGALLAQFVARLLGLSPSQTGAYVVCGGFTNLGSLGALFVYLFLGESAIAYVAFFSLFERFFYFLFGFPYAKSKSSAQQAEKRKRPAAEGRSNPPGSWEKTRFPGHSGPCGCPKSPLSLFFSLIRLLKDPFVISALLSTAAGTLLNLSGLARPIILGTVNAVLIPLSSFLLLVSIGLAMRFGRMRPYLQAALWMGVIKHLAVPAAAVGIGLLTGLHYQAGGMPFKAVLILSSMPVGFTALVPPTVYGLDLDLANTSWLVSTASLLAAVPLLGLILGLF